MSKAHRRLTRTWRKLSCDCGGFSFGGIKGHWDQCALMRPDEPKAYLISQFAADNLLAFQKRHGRMPYANEEAIVAMLHGAKTEVVR